MPTVYKILGQQAPIGVTETDLYTVPGSTSTVVSSITVANRGPDLASFRVSISQGGVATSTKDYLYYDVPLAGNDTFIATVGLTLAATDKVRVYAGGLGGDDLTFQLFGSELT
jgi:hypothetical protein